MKDTEQKKKIRKATADLKLFLTKKAINEYNLNDKEFSIVMLQIATHLLNDELNYQYEKLE